MHTMSGLDATFLYFETPSMHMHVLGTFVIDPSTAPHGWSSTAVRDLLRERLPLIPVFRRRLLPSALRLHHPVWVDTDVDVDAHISKADCPAPGTMEELAGVVADFAAKKLDRSRPLWEALVVEGMADGRVAVVMKVHHSAVDGVGASEVLGAILDLDPSGRTEEQVAEAAAFAAEVKAAQPPMLDRLLHTATGVVTRPLAVAKLLPVAVRSVSNLVAARSGDGSASGGGAVPFVAPRASFNGPISPERVVAFVDVPVEDVKKVKRAAGGTFNDVLISVCGGAFRRYMEKRQELPSSSLIAVCPISVRSEGQSGGNATSAMFTTLGTDIADPLERHEVVRRANDQGKADHEALGSDLLQQAAEIAPPNLTHAIARAYSAVRLADLHPIVHNVIISNVPGPPVQLYFAGGAIEGLYPLGPVLEGPGLNLTVVSYRDRVGFGFIACAERMPDVGNLASEIPAAMAELVEAAARLDG